MIPLSTVTHAAIESTGYTPQGKAAVVYTHHGGISEIAIFSLPWLDRMSANVDEPSAAIAIIFPDDDMLEADIDDAARLLHAAGGPLRDAGGTWETIAVYGGVRFRIFSEHGWLDEPETDRMSNSRLDELIGMFAGRPRRCAAPFDVEGVASAIDQWIDALDCSLAGRPVRMPAEGSLQSGAVRDAVIVWAVGEAGDDRLEPGEKFVPPALNPNPQRITAAFSVLSSRIGEADTVHALACASYLAWWSGHPRLAAHLYYRVRSTGQRSRLGTLVWTALIRQVPPHWMR